MQSIARITDDDGYTFLPFPPDGRMWANARIAIDEAQDRANVNGAPCVVWDRDGWYTVCDLPPDSIEPDPTLSGWMPYAEVIPTGWDA